MKEIGRRRFLQVLGVSAGSAALACAKKSRAQAGTVHTFAEGREGVGILVDVSECVGCRSCEEACAEANHLTVPDISDEGVFAKKRDMSPDQWTVVNRYEPGPGQEVFVKKQCMHCLEPACVSACLTKAMFKTSDGPVIWREAKCMGCRYCMVSCPFDVPTFEYHSANPRIQKCVMCWERLKEGEPPACVENCGGGALTFGRRSELLKQARQKIHDHPDRYIDHIYGETEAGGTAVMYISPVPFEKLGMRTDLDHSSYPLLTKGFLYSVPLVLTVVPALLLGLSRATRPEDPVPRGTEDGDGDA